MRDLYDRANCKFAVCEAALQSHNIEAVPEVCVLLHDVALYCCLSLSGKDGEEIDEQGLEVAVQNLPDKYKATTWYPGLKDYIDDLAYWKRAYVDSRPESNWEEISELMDSIRDLVYHVYDPEAADEMYIQGTGTNISSSLRDRLESFIKKDHLTVTVDMLIGVLPGTAETMDDSMLEECVLDAYRLLANV